MKRTRTIVADRDGRRVEVVIRVNTRYGLARDEVGELVDDLSDAIMRAIPDVRYMHVPLSRIKVRP